MMLMQRDRANRPNGIPWYIPAIACQCVSTMQEESDVEMAVSTNGVLAERHNNSKLCCNRRSVDSCTDIGTIYSETEIKTKSKWPNNHM